MEALLSKLFVTVSRSKYVGCLLISTKWIIIHNDMNLYTLLINQCCRLNIIYLYVCSLDITSPRDITNVFMTASNQNRNTYTLVKVVSEWKGIFLVLFLWRTIFPVVISKAPLVVWKFWAFQWRILKRPVRNVSTIKSGWKVFHFCSSFIFMWNFKMVPSATVPIFIYSLYLLM